MKLEESIIMELFHNALCNIGSYFNDHGIELDYNEDEYERAKENWKAKHPNQKPCIEDVLIQILEDGNELIWNDREGDGDNDCRLTKAMLIENFEFVPRDIIGAYLCENDDAETADSLIQSVLYKEIIFG